MDNLPYWAREQTNGEINAEAIYNCVRDAGTEIYDAIKGYVQCQLLFPSFMYSAK